MQTSNLTVDNRSMGHSVIIFRPMESSQNIYTHELEESDASIKT